MYRFTRITFSIFIVTFLCVVVCKNCFLHNCYASDIDNSTTVDAVTDITNQPAETTTEAIARHYGDIDNDGKITSEDARLILRAAVGLEHITDDIDFSAADVDFDGIIAAADARAALRQSVGLDTTDTSEVHIHSWGEWVLIQSATCTQPGIEKKYCALNKNHFATKTTEMLPHSFKLTAVKNSNGITEQHSICTKCQKDLTPFSQPFSAQQIDSAVQICKKYGAVSAQVAMIYNDALYTFTYGTKSSGTAQNEDTKWRVASTSKLVTDMVFLALVDDGIVSLDEDISKYMGYTVRNPNYPNTPITARMIMTHTASFAVSGSSYLADNGLQSSKYYTKSKPGSVYLYSNLGLGVLQAVIENATGKYFTTVAKEKIFDKIGIDAAYLANLLSDTSNIGSLTGRTVTAQLSKTNQPLKHGIGIALGNLTISAKDYCKILQIILNNGKTVDGTVVLSEKSVKEMLPGKYIYNNYGITLGSQIESSVITGKNVYVHTGSVYGMYSCHCFCPSDNVAIFVSTNGASGSLDKASEVYKICLELIRLVYPV